MSIFKASFSLFKSYKLYIFFHIILLSILIYIFFSIKFINNLYDNFISYKYGFTPDIALYTTKEQNLEKIINLVKDNNIKFTYKLGAIKKLKNINFNKDNYKSLNMDISLMGLYFDKKVYAKINNQKCLIVDIKNINQNWLFYLDDCHITTKKINIKTNNGNIPFKVKTKVKNGKKLFRLKTKNLSNEEKIILYKYLVEIINNFDNINHIGIKPPAKIYKSSDNILDHKKRILRDYLGIIFNKNKSFIPSLVSKEIYKQVSWLKKENTFIDINTSNLNETLYIYNEFSNAMSNNIILTKFNKKILGDNYKQFIFFYTSNDKLFKLIKKSFPKMEIKTKNELLGINKTNNLVVQKSIEFFGLFLYFIALLISIMSLSRFYKKFQKNLLLIKSFNYTIYIYSIYLAIILVLSFTISYISFYLTQEMINGYMKSYFYPVVEIQFSYMKEGLMLFFILFIVFIFEVKEQKDLCST